MRAESLILAITVECQFVLPISRFSVKDSFVLSMHVHMYACIHVHMCHGAGAKVGWFKEYRGLTFTM